MEVVVQNPTLDNFNNNNSGIMSSSPYPSSSSSSPKRLGEFYLSAPSSPSRISQLYGSEFEYYFDSEINNSVSGGTVNDNGDDEDGGDDSFAFFVSHETEESSRSAEELFDGGRIKPLEPQGKTHNHVLEDMKKKMIKNELSHDSEHRRGRNRTPTSSPMFSSSNSNRRVTRSHSPYRTPQWEEQEQQQQPLTNKESSILTSSNSSKGSSSSSSSSKRWRLKDLLLFRSASEGRGSSKDQFKSILYNTKKHHEDVITKTSSFRSMDSSSLRRKGHVSAHELHYAMKRAESEDLKKKTFLPYKQGILGRLSGFGI